MNGGRDMNAGRDVRTGRDVRADGDISADGDGRTAAVAATGGVIRLGATECFATLSGALWWPAQNTLVVADLHLEKGSSLARSRQFLPPYDTAETLGRLGRIIAALHPARVVALGDSFHDGGGPARLDAAARAHLAALMAGREWLWIAGNHDPDLPASFRHADAGGTATDETAADRTGSGGAAIRNPEIRDAGIGGTVAAEAEIGGIVLRHEPSPAAGGPCEIAGHLHPVARVPARDRIIRRRCFAAGRRRLVLPAFGALAGGLDVRDPAFAAVLPQADFTAHILGRERIYSLPATALCQPPQSRRNTTPPSQPVRSASATTSAP